MSSLLRTYCGSKHRAAHFQVALARSTATFPYGVCVRMLVNYKRYVSPEIERLISEILKDDHRFERELRSVHRERLVCPVEIWLDDESEPVDAFSRNISTMGIALISDRPVEEKLRATLEIYRRTTVASRIVSECRWCKPFGKKFWVSGWQFSCIARK